MHSLLVHGSASSWPVHLFTHLFIYSFYRSFSCCRTRRYQHIYINRPCCNFGMPTHTYFIFTYLCMCVYHSVCVGIGGFTQHRIAFSVTPFKEVKTKSPLKGVIKNLLFVPEHVQWILLKGGALCKKKPQNLCRCHLRVVNHDIYMIHLSSTVVTSCYFAFSHGQNVGFNMVH